MAWKTSNKKKTEKRRVIGQRTISLTLKTDLLKAIVEMSKNRPKVYPYRRRTPENMIQCCLMWAIWLNGQGFDPDVELMLLEGGYGNWNKHLLESRENEEVTELEALFRLGHAQDEGSPETRP